MDVEKLERKIDAANDKFLVSDEDIMQDSHDK